MSDDESIFLSLGIWVCFVPARLHAACFTKSSSVSRSFIFPIYADVYDIYYYCTRRIDVSIFSICASVQEVRPNMWALCGDHMSE